MLLFKYLTYDRKSVLENGLIRFTQPSCFNDPFEALPNVEQFFSTEIVDALFRNLLDENSFNNFIIKFSNEDTIKSLKEMHFSMLGKSHDELIAFYNKLTIGDSTENPTESMKLYWDEQIGILSLSEENDNLTMWSHYSKDHKGFIIGFNPEKGITDNKQCMIKPKKVSYSCARPSLTLFEFGKDKNTRNKQWINDFLFTKSKDWSYENEWRQVNFLNKRDDFKKDEEDIYLFKYNRAAIEEIYLGCNMKPENKQEIKKLVNDWKVAIFEMKLNNKHYCLDKIRIK